MKHLCFFLLFISVLTPRSFAENEPYYYIEKTNLNELPPGLRAKVHRAMTELIVAFDQKEKMPPYYKSKHSSIDARWFIENLTNSFIKDCHASDPNTCFFGGWPSVRNGSCGVPWSSAAGAKAQSLGTSTYDSSKYCGDDNLFRCNPLIFGPGIEQEKVGDSLPRVNGRKNNSSPFSAGICIEVNGTYNGLSKRCQEASLKLDDIRVANGEKPWREGNFLNKENAEEFKNLQIQMAEKCREERQRLNSDNMCDALENSLALTASAVEAQKIADLNMEELFPQCADIQPKAPECNDDLNEAYNPLKEALAELKNQNGCSFSGVQAMESGLLGHLMGLPEYQCPSKITTPTKDQFKEGPYSIQFFGKDEKLLGRLEVNLKEGMSKEEILKQITFNKGSHVTAFDKMCNETICPKSENESLSPLYEALNDMKAQENCQGIGSVIAVDFNTGNNELYQAKKCPVAVDGKLESEGISSEGEKVSFILRDNQDNYLLTVTEELNSTMTAKEIKEAIQGGDYRKMCRDLAQGLRVDPNAAKADLGINEDAFVPGTWNENNVLARLRNIGGLFAEINEDGSLKITSENIREKFQAVSMVLRNSPHIPHAESLIVISKNDDGEEYLTIKAPVSAQVEVLSHKAQVELSPTEKELLVGLADSKMGAAQIGRTQKDGDAAGHLVIQGSYPQGETFFDESEEVVDGLFITGLTQNCPEDKEQPCEYVFTASPERAPASEPIVNGPQ